jgi:hypothetical protein
LLVADWPLRLVMMSPARSPAAADGPPGTTSLTNSPCGVCPSSAVDGMGTVAMPKKACVALPVLMMSLVIVFARSTGIAKPSPMLPPLDSPDEVGTVAPAVGTPINCPEQLTIAPPLLPGLMAASV